MRSVVQIATWAFAAAAEVRGAELLSLGRIWTDFGPLKVHFSKNHAATRDHLKI